MAEPIIERILVITAHPDDVDFGAAGTIAKWTAEGIDVRYCIVTDGNAGGSDRAVSREAVARLRREEQRKAAAVVGVSEVEFLGYPDGRVVATLDLRRDLSRAIRQCRPDRVLCPSAERDYSRLPASHPDHLAVGEAALAAIYPDARNPFAHPELLAEGLEPHIVREIWIMASPRSDHFVDVSATIENKIEALRCHASQLSDPDATGQMIRDWSRTLAERAGFGADRHAEGFFLATLPF